MGTLMILDDGFLMDRNTIGGRVGFCTHEKLKVTLVGGVHHHMYV